MMGSVVDYDEMSTHCRREAIYYGTFSQAAGIDPAVAALILPIILRRFGYTTANPLGVRLAWVVAGVCSFLGALADPEFKSVWLYTQNPYAPDVCLVLNEASDHDWSSFLEATDYEICPLDEYHDDTH
jgi:hypothetical protein